MFGIRYGENLNVDLCPVFTLDGYAKGSFKGAGMKDNPYVWEAE